MNDQGKTAEEILVWLRALTAGWLGVEEGTSHDNPCFRVGKSPFAVVDHYQGEDCLFLKIEPAQRAAVLAKPGWFPAPYDPNERGACRRLQDFDLTEAEPLVLTSYRLAAPRRISKTWAP